MKRVSVSDLRNNFRAIERMLRRGEIVDITKRKKVIGRLLPVEAQPKPQKQVDLAKKPEMPDFLARMRKTFGNRVLKVTAAQRIAEDRDRY